MPAELVLHPEGRLDSFGKPLMVSKIALENKRHPTLGIRENKSTYQKLKPEAKKLKGVKKRARAKAKKAAEKERLAAESLSQLGAAPKDSPRASAGSAALTPRSSPPESEEEAECEFRPLDELTDLYSQKVSLLPAEEPPPTSRSPSLGDTDKSDDDKAPEDEIAVVSQEAVSSGDIPAAIADEQQLVDDLDERSPSIRTPYLRAR